MSNLSTKFKALIGLSRLTAGLGSEEKKMPDAKAIAYKTFEIMGEPQVRAGLVRPCVVMSKDKIEDERKVFEVCFPSAKGKWMPDKHNGHGGYQDSMNDDNWRGWITRAILTPNVELRGWPNGER